MGKASRQGTGRRLPGCLADPCARGAGSYDPATGDVVETETSFPARERYQTNESEGGGVAGTQELEVWIDMQGIGDVWPTTRDRLEYLGKSWKVVAIDPKYSGDTLYACKLTGGTRNGQDAEAGSGRP